MAHCLKFLADVCFSENDRTRLWLGSCFSYFLYSDPRTVNTALLKVLLLIGRPVWEAGGPYQACLELVSAV